MAMGRRSRILVGLVAVVSMIDGIGPASASPPRDADIRARADALIARMTPEEKAAQLVNDFPIPVPGSVSEPDQHARDGVGSFRLVTDPKEANRLQRIAVEQSRLKIPLMFGFDVVHGLSTIFPVPIGTAASWDPALIEKGQAVAAAEARSVGLHWTFAPNIDIARDPRWGRIVEGAGEDPYLASAIAAAQVRGFQGAYIGAPGRIIAGPKHFAGYGAALGGRDYDEADLSDAQLWNVYLPPFKAALDAGAGNVMSAYMALNGIPASGNRWLLTDVLRKQWHFEGWVVSDAEAVNDLKTHAFAADKLDAASKAMDAGLDMEMSRSGAAYFQLPEALRQGRVREADIDDAVRRVLMAKIRMGLFEKPFVDEGASAHILRAPEHLELARIAAERSAVLLKNDRALLPLDRTKIRSVAVIGTLADSPRDTNGPWVFKQNKPAEQSILAGIRAKLTGQAKVTFSPGVAIPKPAYPSGIDTYLNADIVRPEPRDDATGIGEAAEAAKSADVAILVLGEPQGFTGEQSSSQTLDLPGRQRELLNAVCATGTPVVILLVNGRPLTLGSDCATAVLDIWYPGSRGGDAAANLIFGDATPGGKLPFTWPRSVGQVPLIYSALISHSPEKADERYLGERGDPLYPFGYGMSYSTFTFSNLRVGKAEMAPGETTRIFVDLKNVGGRAADEVAQLYIHQRSGRASRPVRELKGFQRVTLKPGEMRTLTFSLGEKELRYWNAAVKDWVVDDSVFDVGIGADSTVPLTGSFTVKAAK